MFKKLCAVLLACGIVAQAFASDADFKKWHADHEKWRIAEDRRYECLGKSFALSSGSLILAGAAVVGGFTFTACAPAFIPAILCSVCASYELGKSGVGPNIPVFKRPTLSTLTSYLNFRNYSYFKSKKA